MINEINYFWDKDIISDAFVIVSSYVCIKNQELTAMKLDVFTNILEAFTAFWNSIGPADGVTIVISDLLLHTRTGNYIN